MGTRASSQGQAIIREAVRERPGRRPGTEPVVAMGGRGAGPPAIERPAVAPSCAA